MHTSTLTPSPKPMPFREAYRRADQPRAIEGFPGRLEDGAAIAVRELRAGDRARLRRLAGRDSSPVPDGRLLGAEVDGELVAALSLGDGRVLADPFRPSEAAVELLRLRTRQLGGSGRRRLRLPLRRPRARGGLAGSPPGAGGRLLQL